MLTAIPHCENRRYCQNQHSSERKPLGRPKKAAENASELKVQRQLEYQDEIDRIAVEASLVTVRKGTLGELWQS